MKEIASDQLLIAGRILVFAMWLNLTLMCFIASFHQRRQSLESQKRTGLSLLQLLRDYLPRKWRNWLIFSTLAGVALGIALVLKAYGKI